MGKSYKDQIKYNKRNKVEEAEEVKPKNKKQKKHVELSEWFYEELDEDIDESLINNFKKENANITSTRNPR